MTVFQVKQGIVGAANSSVLVVEEVRGSNQQPAKGNNDRLAPAVHIHMPYDDERKPAGQQNKRQQFMM